MSYEIYVADFEEGADRFARRLDDTENRFFETVCSIGKNYRPPAQREANEPSAHQLRRELREEIEGAYEYEPDEPPSKHGYGHETVMLEYDWEIEQDVEGIER
jgi:hypothetical protein